jgi:hypothetical protein
MKRDSSDAAHSLLCYKWTQSSSVNTQFLTFIKHWHRSSKQHTWSHTAASACWFCTNSTWPSVQACIHPKQWEFYLHNLTFSCNHFTIVKMILINIVTTTAHQAYSQTIQLMTLGYKTLQFKAVCKMVANKSNIELETRIFQIDHMNYCQFMRCEWD